MNLKHSYIFIQENSFENIVWEMAAISSQPQWIKRLAISIHSADSLHQFREILLLLRWIQWGWKTHIEENESWMGVSEIHLNELKMNCYLLPFKDLIIGGVPMSVFASKGKDSNWEWY